MLIKTPSNMIFVKLKRKKSCYFNVNKIEIYKNFEENFVMIFFFKFVNNLFKRKVY